jgi:hypothetical protein
LPFTRSVINVNHRRFNVWTWKWQYCGTCPTITSPCAHGGINNRAWISSSSDYT